MSFVSQDGRRIYSFRCRYGDVSPDGMIVEVRLLLDIFWSFSEINFSGLRSFPKKLVWVLCRHCKTTSVYVSMLIIHMCIVGICIFVCITNVCKSVVCFFSFSSVFEHNKAIIGRDCYRGWVSSFREDVWRAIENLAT
jgi:hypothetical protein